MLSFDFFLGLSATLTNAQRSYLESLGVHDCFKLPLKVGLQMGVLPSYYTFNVAVELLEEEKREEVVDFD